MALQNSRLPGTDTAQPQAWEAQHAQICRRAAAEGMVLLENNGILPLHAGDRLALYGSGARYTVKGGTGSGSVNNRYAVSVDQGLRDAGIVITTDAWLDDYDLRRKKAREDWMAEIYAHSAPGDFDSFYRAHATRPLRAPAGMEVSGGDCESALYVISRISGEGADRTLSKGDYFLSEIEEAELQAVCRAYRNVIVVLNVGGVMDLSFMDAYPISALVLMSQAGQEGGHALADVLTGAVPFSGHLTDSWPVHYEDIHDSAHFSHNDGNIIREYYTEDIYVGYRFYDTFSVKPRYAFGYGLTYTSFARSVPETLLFGAQARASLTVTNTGRCEGRDMVQFYAACPWGLRRKEAKRLVAFAKTPLLRPGESCSLSVSIPLRALASFHTGRAAWFLDAGDYVLLSGSDAAHVTPFARLQLRKTAFLHETGNILPLQDALKTLNPERQQAIPGADACPAFDLTPCLDAISCQFLPEAPCETDRPYREEAERILRTLNATQKAALCAGRLSSGKAEFIGNAAAQVPGAAGETASVLLASHGLRGAVMADGPAGLRVQQHVQLDPETLRPYEMTGYERLENRFFGKEFLRDGALDRYQFASAIPVGTLLAQSFDTDLVEQVGAMIADEMERLHVDIWLAPGMNIHRNPLCGRNFEYFSEDPLLSGLMAAAMTKGVQRNGRAVTIKHFACNNQEENRRGVSSVVSERALREIYLLGFEIAVRTSHPKAIMTSYNKINSVHTANSRDLCTRTAREQWGFDGIIMTDWTTTNALGGASAAKCVAAGNDVVMPGKESDVLEILDALERKGDLRLDEKDLDDCVRRVLTRMLALHCGRTEEA